MTTTTSLTNDTLLAISQRWPGSCVQRLNVMAGDVGGRFVRSAQPGTSDVIGMLAPSGKFIGCEIKLPGDVLTDRQFSFLQAIHNGGGIALVVGRSGLRRLPDGVPAVETVEEAILYIESRLPA